MPYHHAENFGRDDIIIEVLGEPQPWRQKFTVSGKVRVQKPLQGVDDSGLACRVGGRLLDPQTGESVAHFRSAPMPDMRPGEAAPFVLECEGFGIRPEQQHVLQLGLVIDGVGWYSRLSEAPFLLRKSEDFADVGALLAELSVEDLNRTADEYFISNYDNPWMRTKPFHLIEGYASIVEFAFVLLNLRCERGMRIMDFGAGTGWASRWLWQFGLSVDSVDVSSTALAISEVVTRKTVAYEDLEPIRFSRFDGYHLDLPDACLDRAICLSALHHVPNLEDLFSELARVMKPGARAGFAEPGERHSLSLASQWEMINFRVTENDVDLSKINAIATARGFAPIEVLLHDTHPGTVSLDQFKAFKRGQGPREDYCARLVDRSNHSQIFFFQKL